MRDQTFDAVAQDIRHAIRRLLKDWRFTAAAVVILALGIGANTAMFSLINAALLRGQSTVDVEHLVDIYQNASNPGGVGGNSYPAYLDMAAYTDVFASTTAVCVPLGVNYQDDGALRPGVVEYTTATYPSVLGIRPSLGRWFTPAEDTLGAEVVAVLGHQAWMRKFRGDPSAIGRTIRIEGVPVRIVGVGPAGHNGTVNIGLVTDFWLPIASFPVMGAPPRALARNPGESAFMVKARLRDGVTVAQAQAAMNILGRRLASEYPKEDPGKGIAVFASRDVRIHPELDGVARAIASVLFTVVGLVLAIACSNLATLLLVRGAARAKEVSVRLALGATRAQIVRHLLIESVLLATAGGLAGCLLAWWAIQWFGTLDLPITMDVSVDARVLFFTVALSVFTGVAFGLSPALKATRIDLVPALRDESETRSADRGWFTLKNALVVFQVVVSVVLLGGTSIFLQMLTASRLQRTGFSSDGIAMIETRARYAGYSDIEAQAMSEELRRRVAAIPGVESALLARGLPMQVDGARLVVEGAAEDAAVSAGSIWAGPGYFDLLRIPLLFGRAIDERDRLDTPRVAVVSETMARQYFGTANAVGRRFRFEGDANSWMEVVGVARDTGTSDLQGDLVDPTPQLFYRSFAQSSVPPDTVVARTSLDATRLVGAMQQEMRTLNAALPVIAAKTMAQFLEESLFASKAVATMFGALGALGLSLAGIGLYALVAFRVSRRAREIGIRMALGARGSQVVWTVAKEVFVLVGVGTAMGLLLSVLAMQALGVFSAPAPGVSFYRPTVDPVVLMSIAAFMGFVALAASSVPAWRAARMDPLKALRHD